MDVFDDLHTRCFVFIYWRSDLFAASHAHFARSKKIVGVRGTHLKKGFLLEVGDEQNHRREQT
jgi:hypothetical protein